MSQTATPSSSIEPAYEFPVQWEQPGNERLFWAFDPGHFREPITPLDGSAGIVHLVQDA